jgi:hypothetical protein
LIQKESVKQSVSTKVFSTFIEQIQNIIHYSSEKVYSDTTDASLSFGMVVIGRKDDNFFVLCSNKIQKDKVDFLEKKLEHLRNMDKDQVKAYYKERRKQKPENEDSKGAGLGFIEMAKSATKPIEFSFKDIGSDEDVVFALQVTI